MDRLKNKVAVITGGNSGIGFATAQEFIAEGADVIIIGRNAQSVNEAVAKLGAKATGITADVQNMADLKQLAQRVQQLHARIDILFINAGISMAASIDQVDEAHFDSLFDINVKGHSSAYSNYCRYSTKRVPLFSMRLR